MTFGNRARVEGSVRVLSIAFRLSGFSEPTRPTRCSARRSDCLNCLSAQWLFGTRLRPHAHPRDGGAVSIAFRPNGFSEPTRCAGTGEARAARCRLNCLSAEWLFGTRVPARRSDAARPHVSIAFRLNGFSEHKLPCALWRGRHARVSIAFRLNGFSEQVGRQLRQAGFDVRVSIAFRLNGFSEHASFVLDLPTSIDESQLPFG